MKNWFPFTDYDFYAYLTAGMVVLFSVDYGINGGAIMLRESWPFIQCVFVIAMAYIVGHIIAGLASIVLERWVVHRLLRSPVAVMMGLGKPRFRETIVGRLFVGRYYEPLPEKIRANILDGVAGKLGTESKKIDDAEEVFQVAFAIARTVSDSAERMDAFLRLYGFARNVALSGVVGAAAMIYRATAAGEDTPYWWAGIIVFLSISMFGRFLKFYAAYGAEVLRTYASSVEVKSE